MAVAITTSESPRPSAPVATSSVSSVVWDRPWRPERTWRTVPGYESSRPERCQRWIVSAPSVGAASGERERLEALPEGRVVDLDERERALLVDERDARRRALVAAELLRLDEQVVAERGRGHEDAPARHDEAADGPASRAPASPTARGRSSPAR